MGHPQAPLSCTTFESPRGMARGPHARQAGQVADIEFIKQANSYFLRGTAELRQILRWFLFTWFLFLDVVLSTFSTIPGPSLGDPHPSFSSQRSWSLPN